MVNLRNRGISTPATRLGLSTDAQPAKTEAGRPSPSSTQRDSSCLPPGIRALAKNGLNALRPTRVSMTVSPFPMNALGEKISKGPRWGFMAPRQLHKEGLSLPPMTKTQADHQLERECLRESKKIHDGEFLSSLGKRPISYKGLPTTNFHMHFRGSVPARVSAHFTPYVGTFEETVERIREEDYYSGAKDLGCYLQHYTPTSNRIPVDTPEFAEAAARQIAFEYAEHGVVMTEVRLPAFGNLDGYDKFSGLSKEEFDKIPEDEKEKMRQIKSEKFLEAFSRGWDHGSKIAKSRGFQPTRMGLLIEGNRFTPSVMFNKEFVGTREEKLQKSIEDAAVRVSASYKEAIRQIMKKGNPAKICAVGLAGLEPGHPASAFAESFDLIHAHNAKMVAAKRPDKIIGISIHAGEVGTVEQATQSVIDAILTGWRPDTPLRIGHGVKANMEKVKQTVGENLFKRVSFELCATSNYQITDMSEEVPHTSKDLENKSWCSDNDAISGHVGHEYQAAGLTPLEARRDNLNGLKGSFLYRQMASKDQDKFLKSVEKRWDAAGVTEDATDLIFESVVTPPPATPPEG